MWSNSRFGLLVVCVSCIIAVTVYMTWGPVYEERCTEPTAEELESVKKMNSVVKPTFGGDFQAQAKCSKVLVR